ncbi:MAG: pseudouridine synthase [Eubacteriales bacterium]
MRLNKYIAQCGVTSRRKADEMISAGKVKINDQVVKELGYIVMPEDKVSVNGNYIKLDSKFIYIILNKPLGYIATVSDDKERPTVLDLVSDIGERLYPIGRLDYNTSGLLILTNDGDLAYKLTHPKHVIYKTYRARVTGVISKEKAAKLSNGVDIGGYITAKAKVKIEKSFERSTILELQVYEGKNRQIRKMISAVDSRVIELERIAVGDLRLGHLKEGHYRKLTPAEIEYLKNC